MKIYFYYRLVNFDHPILTSILVDIRKYSKFICDKKLIKVVATQSLDPKSKTALDKNEDLIVDDETGSTDNERDSLNAISFFNYLNYPKV